MILSLNTRIGVVKFENFSRQCLDGSNFTRLIKMLACHAGFLLLELKALIKLAVDTTRGFSSRRKWNWQMTISMLSRWKNGAINEKLPEAISSWKVRLRGNLKRISEDLAGHAKALLWHKFYFLVRADYDCWHRKAWKSDISSNHLGWVRVAECSANNCGKVLRRINNAWDPHLTFVLS